MLYINITKPTNNGEKTMKFDFDFEFVAVTASGMAALIGLMIAALMI